MHTQFQTFSAFAVAISLFAGSEIACFADDSALADSEASLIETLQKSGALRAELDRALHQKEALVRALAEASMSTTTHLDAHDEALGNAALSDSASGVEQRLLAAVNDLRIMEGENRALRSHLHQVTEAASFHLSKRPGAESDLRREIESSVSFLDTEWTPERAIAELTGFRSGEVVSQNIEIVGVRPELGLIVLGKGASSGLRAGMPLVIERNGESVATATLIEARKSLAGAVLTGASLEDGAVTVGDFVQLATSDFNIGR